MTRWRGRSDDLLIPDAGRVAGFAVDDLTIVIDVAPDTIEDLIRCHPPILHQLRVGANDFTEFAHFFIHSLSPFPASRPIVFSL